MEIFNSIRMMYKRIIFVLIMVELSMNINFTMAQSIEFPKPLPKKQEYRISNIDIQHIAIDLQFDWNKKQAYGTSSIRMLIKNPTDTICLDAGMLTIQSVVMDNGLPLNYLYNGSDEDGALKIILDHDHKKNDSLTLHIHYLTNSTNEIDLNNLSGTNGSGMRFLQPTYNDPLKHREIWTFGDPKSNRNWFPSYDAPNDLRTTELRATVDQNLTVISNGVLKSLKKNLNGTQTFIYETTIPFANHQTSLIIGEFVDIEQKVGNLKVHNYGYSNESESIKASVERLPDMIRYFSKATGIKYPFSSYAQVFVQDMGTFSGNNMVSTITENMIDDRRTHADFFYLWDLTEAEALAQQWFGNYVLASDWSDVWLNKSFAHYFNELYNEHKNGREEFLMYQLSFDQSVYWNDWNSNYRHPIVTQNYESINEFTSDNYATYRGSMVLHMLRKQIGEEKWWKTVRLYLRDHAHQLVTTRDFINVVEKVCKEDLDWFFDQWIYKMGHPVFLITKKYDSDKNQLKVVVRQTQKIDDQCPYPQKEYFKGKVVIEIDERLETVWLNDHVENVFIFSLDHAPRLVNFDFENTWIGEKVFDKSLDEWLYQLQYSRDVLARQKALNELSALARNEITTAENKSKIIDEIRKVILSNSYFRLKNSAIVQLRNLNVNSENSVDSATQSVLIAAMQIEKSWTLAALVNSLGMTRDSLYADRYIKLFNDFSFRVIHAAAVALGKTKSSKAYDALVNLSNKPSMKSQSLICALVGLKELGDPRAYELALKALSIRSMPRWRLPNSGWDYRIFAAQTIASLGKSSAVFPLILKRIHLAIQENDLEGVFNNLLIINTLEEPTGQSVYDMLKEKYSGDKNVLSAIEQYETQFKDTIQKK